MKRIYITFPNDEVWTITVQDVAKSRAQYYAARDYAYGEAVGTYADAYRAELEYGLRNEAECIDYLQNNMDWHEACRLATARHASGYDYAAEFDNARFEVKGE